MKAYYEARAPVYDDWWLGTGPFVVVDSALRDDVEPVEWQERRLRDGSTWQVYKRFFEPVTLAAELGGGETVFDGRWFVAVRSAR